MKKIFVCAVIALSMITFSPPNYVQAAQVWTAWICKKHPTKKNWCTKFYSGIANSATQAKKNGLKACGSILCKVMYVKKGCISYKLKKSGRVLKPKGC